MRHQPHTKLKNLQWQKLDLKSTNKTIWSLDDICDLETQLSKAGVFETLDALFAARTNVVFERKLMAKTSETKGAIKFLSESKRQGLGK
jgi:hypothetical protein